jgi:hypothetical protein
MKRNRWVSKLVIAHVMMWGPTALVCCLQSGLHPDAPLLSYNSHLLELFKEYQKRHRLTTSSPASGARYVITHEAPGGMGNTVPGIVSAFFLALVLNRTLLVECYNYLSYLDHGGIDFRYAEQVRSSSPTLEYLYTCGMSYALLLPFFNLDRFLSFDGEAGYNLQGSACRRSVGTTGA